MQKKKVKKPRGHRTLYNLPKPEGLCLSLSWVCGEPLYPSLLKEDGSKVDLFPVFNTTLNYPIDGPALFRRMLIRIAARQVMEEKFADQIRGDETEEDS